MRRSLLIDCPSYLRSRAVNVNLRLFLAAIIFAFFSLGSSYAQSGFCNTSEPFCTNDIMTFPAGVNTGSAESGPDYGCLFSQPNPAWYHMRIAIPGSITIEISSAPAKDIDFICWGPFDSPHDPCSGQLTSSKIADCSYAGGTGPEYCEINNTLVGEYYILLLTNYSNDPCLVTYAKTAGNAETDCGIVPAQASNNSPICEGETLELYGEPVNNASYFWTGPNSFTSNLQNPIITNSQLYHSGTYELTITIGGNNSNPYPTEVDIFALPTADFTYTTVCEGEPIQFTDLSSCSTPETPIDSWLWDFGDGNTSSDQNPNHLYAIGGPSSYNVNLTVTTTGGCSSNTSQTISVLPKPVALFSYTFDDGTSCENSPISFNDLSTSQGNIMSWSWDFGDGNVSTDQNPTHTYSSSGTYLVSLTVENDNSCDSTYSENIIINATPAIDFSFTNVCFGIHTSFYDTNHINVGATSNWLYDFGDGGTSNESNPTHLYSSANDYNVQFSITDTNGCANSTSHSVSVFDAPIAQFTYDTVCQFTSTQFTDQSSPSSGIDFWNWDFGDNQSSTNQNPTHTYNQAGLFDTQLVVGNNDGCSDTVNNTIWVWEPPNANFLHSDSSCTEGLVYFNDSSWSNESFINQYTWFFPDGHISYDPNTYFVFLNPEYYYDVSLEVIDIRGCKDTVTESVFIDPEFRISFIADTVCYGQSTSLYSYVVAPNDDSIVQYTWSFKDGSSQVTTPNDTVSHIFSEPGNYEVMLQAENIYGCLNTARKNVKVWENPQAGFSFTESYCYDSSNFINESLPGDGAIQKWTWYFGDGTSEEINNPSNPNIFHHYAPMYGLYDIDLYIEDIYGCLDSSENTLAHYPCVFVNYFTDTSWICEGTQAVFIDSTIVDDDFAINQKIWDFGDGNTMQVDPNVDTVYYQYEYSGTYETKLQIEYLIEDLTIQDSSMLIVEILPSPKTLFTSEEVCKGANTTIINLSSINNDHFEWVDWSFGDGKDTSYQYIPGSNELIHYYSQDGTYPVSLKMRASNNCQDSITKEYRVNPIPEIGFWADSTIFCGNSSVIFRDTSQINSGMIANRLWTFGDGAYLSTSEDTAAHYFESGTYSIRLENTSDLFCKSSLLLDDYILINPVIESDFSIEQEEISILRKSQIELNNFVDDQVYTNWSLSDSIKWENRYIPNIADSIQDTGFYEIKQYTINEFGCIDSSSQFIKITPAYTFYVPSAFSPNNNGLNDSWGPLGKYFDLESYNMKVFSRWGELIFESNSFYQQWDGRMKSGKPAPMGTYAYIIRLTDMQGNNKLLKGSVTLLL